MRGTRPGASALSLLTILALAATPWASAQTSTPDVVRPARWDGLDPRVASLVREIVAEVEASPDDSAAHGRLGMAYEANNLWREARDCYARAADLDPLEKLWRFHLAISARQAGDAPAALELMRHLAREHPDFAPLRQRLGEALLESGETEEARLHFERLMALEPDQPQGYTGLGAVLIREGNNAEAAVLLEKAVALAPSYLHARYLLGLAYRGMNRREEAKRELALGVGATVRYLPDRLSPEIRALSVGFTGQMEQARGELDAGRPGRAARLLEQCLESRPGSVEAMNNLSIAYMRMGQLDRARDVLLEARRVAPDRFSVSLNLSSVAIREGHLDEALAHADAAVEQAPGVAQARAGRGNVLAMLERYDEARAAFEAAARLEPDDPANHLALGDLCLRLGRFEDARGHFETAARLSPRLWPAYLGLAHSLLELGRLSEADEALSAARRLAPDHPRLEDLERRLRERTRP